MDNDKLNGIITNLRHCDDYHGNIEHDTFDNAIEAIEQLRKERDIARGMYCSLAEWHDKTGKGGAEASAAVLGWDVYAKEGKA